MEQKKPYWIKVADSLQRAGQYLAENAYSLVPHEGLSAVGIRVTIDAKSGGASIHVDAPTTFFVDKFDEE